MTMKKVEDRLPADQFIRVHRSFIVNLSKIVDIEDNTIVIGKKGDPGFQ
ncbi:MAG: LytTR family DNA-binding domain-containing protein [Bacteroidia bacterium]